MMNEMKDAVIKQRMDAYFDGTPSPEIDLTLAKREVRRRAKRGTKRWAAVISSCAAVVLAAVLMWNLLPVNRNITRYSVANATPVSTSFTALSEEYSALTAPFAPFMVASNASAEYFVYELNDKAVLMCVGLRLIGSGMQARANVYIDLTDGSYRANEFEEYETLEKKSSGYRYDTVYEGGEYVSRAYCKLPAGSACYVDLTANDSHLLSQLMSLMCL